MSKFNTYLFVIGAALVAIALGYIIPITAIKSVCTSCLNYAQYNSIAVTAAVCAFLFYGRKNYVLLIIAAAVVTALVTQYLIAGHGAGLFTLAMRTLAFLLIVYLMNFIKEIFNRIF